MDVTAVTAFISGPVTTAILGIGGVLLVLVVTIAGYRWVQRMIR